MANIDKGLKELWDCLGTRLDSNYITFKELHGILLAMREPALPVDDRAITRGQADAINRRQTELFKQINDIQSIISGTKRKWRDEVDRRLNNLEGNITKDNNGDLIKMTVGNTADPCGTGCALEEGKKTIEIDREIAFNWFIKNSFDVGTPSDKLHEEIKRALAGGK